MTCMIDGCRKCWTRHRGWQDVCLLDTLEAWSSWNISLQKWHAASTLVIVVKVCLLLLEFLFVMHFPANHIKCDTGLDESVRANRMAVMLTSPIAISTLAVDTRDRKVGDQDTDSFGKLGVCPIIEIDTYWIR